MPIILLAIILLTTACTTLNKGPEKLTITLDQKELLHDKIIEDINRKPSHLDQEYWATYELSPLITGEPFIIIEEQIIFPADFRMNIDDMCKTATDNVVINPKEVLTLDQYGHEYDDLFLYHEYQYVINCNDLKNIKPEQGLKMEIKDVGYKQRQGLFRDDTCELKFIELIQEDPLLNFREDEEVMTAVHRNEIFIGMPEDALLQSWGRADETTSISTPEGSLNEFLYKGTARVYTVDDVVVDWDEL